MAIYSCMYEYMTLTKEFLHENGTDYRRTTSGYRWVHCCVPDWTDIVYKGFLYGQDIEHQISPRLVWTFGSIIFWNKYLILRLSIIRRFSTESG